MQTAAHCAVWHAGVPMEDNVKKFLPKASQALAVLEDNCLKQSRDAIAVQQNEGQAGRLFSLLLLSDDFFACIACIFEGIVLNKARTQQLFQ